MNENDVNISSEKESKTFIRKRYPWVAAGISITIPGLGHFYNGDILKGICLQLIYLAIGVMGGFAYLEYIKHNSQNMSVKSIGNILIILTLTYLINIYCAIRQILTVISDQIPAGRDKVSAAYFL